MFQAVTWSMSLLFQDTAVQVCSVLRGSLWYQKLYKLEGGAKVSPKYSFFPFFLFCHCDRFVSVCACLNTSIFLFLHCPSLSWYLRYEDSDTLKNQLQMNYIELKVFKNFSSELQFLVLLTETGNFQSPKNDVSPGQEESCICC